MKIIKAMLGIDKLTSRHFVAIALGFGCGSVLFGLGFSVPTMPLGMHLLVAFIGGLIGAFWALKLVPNSKS
ncbi:MAG TPA: hypothetical protein VLA88_00970 [Candidatus Saccharimonadales bacterium]|nr:hypothetical protein [Candidatus Saccharimonadales bacterium]